MTIGVVHATASNSLTPTIPSTVANHGLIVVVNSFDVSGTPTISGVTIGGSPLVQAVSKINGTSGWQSCWIYYKANVAAGQTAIVVAGTNLTVDSSDGSVDIIEVNCPIILDKTNSNSGGSDTMSTGSTGTLSAAEEFAIGAFSGGTPSDTSGDTDVDISGFSLTDYKQVSATTALNFTASNDETFWAAAIATFRRGAGGVTGFMAGIV